MIRGAADIVRFVLDAVDGAVVDVRPADGVGRRVPDQIPGLGPKRLTAYTKCVDCATAGGQRIC
jgi:hypothetical protein